MEIWKEFSFEAAHRLPNVPASTSAPACTGIPPPSAFQLPGKWAAKLAGSWTFQRLGPPSALCANALITTT